MAAGRDPGKIEGPKRVLCHESSVDAYDMISGTALQYVLLYTVTIGMLNAGTGLWQAIDARRLQRYCCVLQLCAYSTTQVHIDAQLFKIFV